jgi:hypothetical protein
VSGQLYMDKLEEEIEELKRQVKYWREAVTRVEPAHANSCCFCGRQFTEPSVSGSAHHKVDCPWLLAQEG